MDPIKGKPDPNDNNHFRIHIDHSHDSKVKSPMQSQTTQKTEKTDRREKEVNKKKSVKSIFKDAGRQIVASAVILVIGIIVLNLSAYYKIAKSEVKQVLGIQEESPLQELVENVPVQSEELALKTSQNPEIQKKQIPELNIEIAPPDNRLIIPRINQNIPVVRISSEALVRRDWNALESEMQQALGDGVVHYPGTSVPGQSGNVVITGHSSYFPWDDGRFKDVFALLHNVVKGDRIVSYWDQKKYVYEVTDIKVILPEEIEVLKQTTDERLTLITCTPVGTNLKRLIVIAKPVGEPKVMR